MKKVLIAFFCVVGSMALFGQESKVREDFEVWLSSSVDMKLNKKFNAEVKIAHRLENNARFQKTSFIEPALSYEITKRFETSLSYRYNYDFLDKERVNRIISRTNYTYRFKPYDLGYRLRFDLESGNNDIVDVVRNRFSFRYKRKKHKLSPGISAELFTSNRRRGWISDKIRLVAELNYRLDKRHRLSLGYMLQNEFNRSRPQRDFILLAGYRYSIKKRKKKESSI